MFIGVNCVLDAAAVPALSLLYSLVFLVNVFQLQCEHV